VGVLFLQQIEIKKKELVLGRKKKKKERLKRGSSVKGKKKKKGCRLIHNQKVGANLLAMRGHYASP
jgi:hypothetical protein